MQHLPHEIDILIEDDRWQQVGLLSLAQTAIAVTLDNRSIPDASVSVLACDDTRMAVLNSDFRDKPVPTNVLSWPEEDLGSEAAGAAPQQPTPDPDGTLSLGDIAIAYDTCAQESEDQGKPFEAHVTHLLVHGTLHLLGYDHIRDLDATRMEALEVEILGKLGLPNPY
ncbi:rRNA maturation RNase YbeY [Tateyamaria sp. syn59]|uniref:rRNA maturation RNase YbeY n=1 Tax=Tateyamaria sp. syn59 TaxID=2576942 RepID=UPI001CB9723A|nr:rRNA maturation RNase YbeY [Tateyamaria sp. syn59]